MKQSRIIQGLMRVDRLDDDQLYDLIRFDLDHGITFFDLADIYVGGEAERKLGRILSAHPELRDKMFIQSKVSIRRGELHSFYDLSKEHILEGVDGILNRLGIKKLDSLLLHRPDIFMDGKEINEAFNQLYQEGKAAHFGVSNFSKGTMDYLSSCLDHQIEYNQVQLGLGHLPLIKEAINFNMENDEGVSRTEDTFFYMKKHHIAIQAWSPFVVGFFKGSLFDKEEFPEMNEAMKVIADKYQSSKCAVATAFLLMLDKDLRVITGSMNPAHVQECLDGENLSLTKEEWYYIYAKAGNMLP